jgi:hypothetical protein
MASVEDVHEGEIRVRVSPPGAGQLAHFLGSGYLEEDFRKTVIREFKLSISNHIFAFEMGPSLNGDQIGIFVGRPTLSSK